MHFLSQLFCQIIFCDISEEVGINSSSLVIRFWDSPLDQFDIWQFSTVDSVEQKN